MFYKLDENKNPVATAGDTNMDIEDRKVGLDEVGDYRVSTVFLQLNHNFGHGKPLLFETMIFPLEDWNDLYCRRYSTWNEAVKGHAETVEKVKRGQLP